MDNEILIAAKEISDSIKEISCNPHIQMCFMKMCPNISFSIEDMLYLDTLKFMLYVSEADGITSQKEINIINYITGKFLTLQDVEKLKIDAEDFLTDCASEPSGLFMFFCNMENAIYQNNGSLNGSTLNILISYFEILGKVIACSDDYVSYYEQERIDTYINMLKQYATEHTLSPFI